MNSHHTDHPREHEGGHGGASGHFHQPPRPPDRAEIEKGHFAETTDTRGLWIFAMLLIVGVVLCIVIASGVTWMYTGQLIQPTHRTLDVDVPADLPAAGTAHWVNPPRDLAMLRRNQQRQLEALGWVNQDEGVARIPIEQAMRILAERREASGTQPLIAPPAEQRGAP